MRALLLATLFGLTACATIHNGETGKTISGEQISDLAISAEQVNDPKTEPFMLSTVTFENKGDSWIRVVSAEPMIGEELASKISVVVGEDLHDWAQARADRNRLDKHNEDMTKMALLGGSAVAIAASGGKNSGVTAAGVIGLAGVEGWIIGDAISDSRFDAKNPKWVPDSHVQRPFAVPGKNFVRKWILFNVPTGVRIKEIPFKLRTADGKEAIVNVKVF